MPLRSDVRVETRGGIAVIELSSPPVNALSHDLRKELMAAIERACADRDIQALVLVGANDTFVGGADIREFGKPYQEPTLWRIDDLLLASGKPVIAAIDGFALGGGLELAFHCHWRIARARARLGLPEVLLGLMPGAGGTQYWTRLAGPRSALEYLTSGKQVGAAEALDLGLIDAVTDGEVREAAITFAREKLAEGAMLPSYGNRTEKLADGTDELFDTFLAEHGRAWRGLLSPFEIVECVRGACSRPLGEMLRAERAAFSRCADSSQARALIHLFFAERAAGRTAEGPILPVRSVGVVGAGTMGGGIAMAFAGSGYPVVLVDAKQAAIDRGMAQIRSTYESSVSKGRIPVAKAEAALGRINPTIALEDIASCDLVVEAVFEDMEVKQALLARLGAIVGPEAIIATNTSMLDIDRLAAVSSHPERLVGMHFFSPAHVMRLLEVVRGAETQAEVVRTAVAIARKLGKVPVITGNGEGFIGNAILDAYGREMDLLIEDGASPWQVDKVMRDFGFAMGLFEMRDMAGLDVIRRVREQRREWERPGRYPLVADRLSGLGRHGQKTGAGYYVYEGRKGSPDPLTERIIHEVATERGIERREIGDEEIRERLLAVMVNAGVRLLESGVAASASDIDLVMVHGYGFPRYRGGPMHWARQQGLAGICAQLRKFAAQDAERPAPSPLLETLAAEGRDWPPALPRP